MRDWLTNALDVSTKNLPCPEYIRQIETTELKVEKFSSPTFNDHRKEKDKKGKEKKLMDACSYAATSAGLQGGV
jgi:hypothetical protein